ncbi:MAG TPA: hypothetical protein VJX30_17090 [Terriglobales bacterium]|jgi:hypothetical protein|nr:hypothetical protein [Terriglobales bacterium]
MADSLYLSLWFPSFDESEILPRTVSVLRQIPFSPVRDGVTYAAIQPVSWSEPTILERRFRPAVPPEEAAEVVAELLHDDYAYIFEAYWDLWTPPEGGEKWVLEPSLVRLIAHGMEFEERAAQDAGHIQIDFGLDTSFLHEEIEFTSEAERNVRSNVHKLIEFTAKVEKNSGATGRLLWSESEENLAQKLIVRLQRVQ